MLGVGVADEADIESDEDATLDDGCSEVEPEDDCVSVVIDDSTDAGLEEDVPAVMLVDELGEEEL